MLAKSRDLTLGALGRREDTRQPREREQHVRPVLGVEQRQILIASIAERSPLQPESRALDVEGSEDDRVLVESLRARGQDRPIEVVKLGRGNGDGQTYRLIDGHRRVEALRFLGETWVWALISDHGSKESDLRTLTAHMRKGLTGQETLEIVERLHDRHDLTWVEIASQTGVSERHIRRLRELGKLDAGVLQMIWNGQITQSVGELLTDLEPKAQVEVANRAQVEQLEAAEVRALLAGQEGDRRAGQPDAESRHEGTPSSEDSARQAALVPGQAASTARERKLARLRALLVNGGSSEADAERHSDWLLRTRACRLVLEIDQRLAELRRCEDEVGQLWPYLRTSLSQALTANREVT